MNDVSYDPAVRYEQSALAGVVNGTSGLPLGPAVVGTAGGLSFTGMPLCTPDAPNCQRQHALNNSDTNAYTLHYCYHYYHHSCKKKLRSALGEQADDPRLATRSDIDTSYRTIHRII